MSLSLYGYTLSSELMLSILFIFVLLVIFSGLVTLLVALELNDLKEQEKLYEDTYCDTY